AAPPPDQDDSGFSSSLIGVTLITGVALALMTRPGKRKRRLSALLLGFGVGLGLGVIAAPQAGSDTRDLLMSRADEGREYLRRHTENLRDSAGDLLDKGREWVVKQREQLASAVEAGKQAYPDKVG